MVWKKSGLQKTSEIVQLFIYMCIYINIYAFHKKLKIGWDDRHFSVG